MSRKVLLQMLLLVLSLFFSKPAVSEILNGGFEDSIAGGDFNTPADWNTVNYAAVVSNFVPNPTNGHYNNWRISTEEPGLLPYEGESFVVLSTCGRDANYSSITQEITSYPGETLFGRYFFGTCDYLLYDDFAKITLKSQNSNNIELVYESVGTVGRESSNDGWQFFEHTFTETDAGSYTLLILVCDVGDWIYESYFAVDGLQLCVRPEEGNINNDCMVDMQDFAILASHWLNDCNSPDWCEEADIDNNGTVDANDLSKVTNNWLNGSG